MIINPQQLSLPSSSHNKKSNNNNNNKHSYDVVDHVHGMEESIPVVRNVTPSFVIDDTYDDNEFSDEQQHQQQEQQQSPLMHENNNNFEFSDTDEPRMTRSQSRAKENSVPPTEEPKPTALKRSKKTTKTERVRRRRPLKEEPISDDDIIE